MLEQGKGEVMSMDIEMDILLERWDAAAYQKYTETHDDQILAEVLDDLKTKRIVQGKKMHVEEVKLLRLLQIQLNEVYEIKRHNGAIRMAMDYYMSLSKTQRNKLNKAWEKLYDKNYR